jgi:hypothetical protein
MVKRPSPSKGPYPYEICHQIRDTNAHGCFLHCRTAHIKTATWTLNSEKKKFVIKEPALSKSQGKIRFEHPSDRIQVLQSSLAPRELGFARAMRVFELEERRSLIIESWFRRLIVHQQSPVKSTRSLVRSTGIPRPSPCCSFPYRARSLGRRDEASFSSHIVMYTGNHNFAQIPSWSVFNGTHSSLARTTIVQEERRLLASAA